MGLCGPDDSGIFWPLGDTTGLAVFTVGAVGVGLWLLLAVLQGLLLRPQNLRRRYGAEWAVVTGAGGGVGRAVAERLAAQGVGVVLVDDAAALKPAVQEMRRARPGANFVSCACDPAGGVVMVRAVAAAAAELQPTLLFCCGSKLATGLLCDEDEDQLRRLHQCNTLAPLLLARHYAREWLDSGRRGFIGLLSCPSSAFPAPLMAAYAAQQAFVTQLGLSLSAELRPFGVDVAVVRALPGPARAHRRANLRALDCLALASGHGGAAATAECFLAVAGRGALHDQGCAARLAAGALQLLGPAPLAAAAAAAQRVSPDHRRLRRLRTALRS